MCSVRLAEYQTSDVSGYPGLVSAPALNAMAPSVPITYDAT